MLSFSIHTRSPVVLAPMPAFAGQNPSGTWIPHVRDSVTIDTGSVRAFTLSLRG